MMYTTEKSEMESTTSQPNIVASNSSSIEMKKFLSLMEEGKSKFTTNQTDIVLVLGMTGSGKTTLVKFLATNNDNLLSEEVGENLGEYLITDSQHKISSNAVISQTIFPEPNIDPESQITFFDAPGFSDTRGLGVDLAGAYFLNQVIVNAEKVRFVLAVNYSSFRQGMDRADFLESLRYMLHFAKQIDNYLESVALVVTKVDNQTTKRDKQMVPVSDENVIEYVAKFLANFKSSIPKVQAADTMAAENMAKVIDVLLRKKGTTYEKITIFRRPNEAGPLSRIKLLQEGKVAIKRLIRDNLSSARPQAGDFGFAISERSKSALHELEATIDQNVADQIGRECQPKIKAYEARSAGKTDVHAMYDVFRKDFQALRDWLATQSGDWDLRRFVTELLEVSRSTAQPFDQAEINRILAQGEYIEYLQMFGGKQITDSTAWKRGLQSYFDYLHNSQTWYQILAQFHQLLSTYDVQKRVKNQAAGAGVVHSNGTALPVTSADGNAILKEFDEILNKKLKGYSSLKMDDVKSRQANEMLESMLVSDTSVRHHADSDTFEIRGKFVVLSELAMANKNIWKAKFVNIFAADKLFVDVDVNREDGQLQALSLVAPTWEIIGDVRMNLNGERGCCTPTYRVDYGDRFGRSGAPGLPGAPGKSAANFFGLATTVVNGLHLTIQANGGRGAAGQDGGDGESGPDGDSPIVERWGQCTSNGNFDNFYSEQQGGVIRGVFCINGKSGGSGGNGGNGGIGGYGGLAGKVNIMIASEESARVKIEANDGPAGAPGTGGDGGEGGEAGRSWYHQKMWGWWEEADCSNSRRLAIEYGSCSNDDYRRNGRRGYAGISGANREGVRVSQPSAAVDLRAVATKYKEFLQPTINEDIINRLPKVEFLKQLDEIRESGDLRVLPRDQGRNSGSFSRRAKRNAQSDQFDSRWVMKDCFKLQQWPITDRIAHQEETTESSLSVAPSTQFSLSAALILTDLLLRKVSKSKANYLECCAVDYTKARHCALQILSTFDKILNSGDGEARIELDPVSLMEKLENEIINGTRENIGKILMDSIANESSRRKNDLYLRLENALSIN